VRFIASALSLINQLRRSFAIAIAIAATLLQVVEIYFAGRLYIEALVLAILLGVAIRTVWKPVESGCQF
jgi:uncharacterized membrane protein YadS